MVYMLDDNSKFTQNEYMYLVHVVQKNLFLNLSIINTNKLLNLSCLEL
jgi:hypothetical protein